jgi:DNA-binding HxlR family transcriptional regulator
MGRTADYSKQRCSVAATLEIVGDPWTLLILRDAFLGARRFEQWQENLGVARNVLAARLRSLVENGVMSTQLYCERPPRKEYLLTPKGDDLRGVLLTMAAWGERHIYGDHSPNAFIHDACGKDFRPKLVCDACNGDLADGALTYVDRACEHATVGEAMEAARA